MPPLCFVFFLWVCVAHSPFVDCLSVLFQARELFVLQLRPDAGSPHFHAQVQRRCVCSCGDWQGLVIALECFVDSRQCLCRVDDYWHGYKLFCYAFYSHSAAHEAEFKDSKLGASLSCTPRSLLFCLCTFRCRLLCGVLPGVCLTSPPARLLAGRLVWRRFASDCTPSHHAVRATCVQLLPLIDMYCKYVLQEDSTNLRGLMVRYDCEADLASHDLGRSMLAMLRDDDDGGPLILPARVHMAAPVSPFDAIRATLAAMDVALQTMRPHVL